jgi:putative N6-adenine-specific DNA methylase
MSGRVGRGGLKLEAAITRFQLAQRIAGARAIDVGASTGGFTEALLAHGAVQVTAIDVGHGQLHPSLRADPRVDSREGVHFPKLPLAEAAGPFDFFTVDVSFIAARTMLRPLAFRLRPGAEGIVLVKPQFELADQRVRGGDVSDPNLRRDALAKVRAKAEALGFELVGHADSPVAGSSGTVEILAYLRFLGRSQKLPQPGERRGTTARARTPAAVDDLAMFAVAAPGIEEVLGAEVRELKGAREVRVVPGGVEFSGDRRLLYRANLWLRTATRVLVRVGELEAREFARLRRRAGTLRWEQFLDGTRPVAIAASQSKSRLYHTGAIIENVQAAIGDRLRTPLPAASDGGDAGNATSEEGPEAIKVVVRGVADRWTFSVDSSGELLHRRGWRSENALAPMRETLAAALLLLCRWDATTPLYDPMCGAGTLPIEACAFAMRIAPGLRRSFACEQWPSADAGVWAELRAEAEAARLAAPTASIGGSDRSAEAIDVAKRNAERAGLAGHLALQCATLAAANPPPGKGLVLVNPPYGRRVGDPRSLQRLYGDLGRLLRSRFAGWRAGVLVADARLAGALGLPVLATHPLVNGGIRVQLLELQTSF